MIRDDAPEAIRVLQEELGHEVRIPDGEQIVDQVLAMEDGSRFQVLAPVVRTRKGEFVDLFSPPVGFARSASRKMLIVPSTCPCGRPAMTAYATGSAPIPVPGVGN